MPSAERNERPEDREEKGSKNKSSPSTKTKDVSHVPCKFFRVGACTAGSSCPFSHNLTEPGAHKDVCAWFVKGNCKFGHKCALAHVLPGQSPSMDRKNKKAAQQAAAASGGGGKDSNNKGRGSGVGAKRDSSARNPLLSPTSSGSRAQNRPPITMPLKASISAPAPALTDTDFTSFDDLEETKLSSAPANPKQAVPDDPATMEKEQSTLTPPPAETTEIDSIVGENDSSSTSPVVPLPVGSPRRVITSPRRPPVDFGPIGSPPRSASSVTSPRSLPRVNGVSASPGTSPNVNGGLSGSPFSAPGTKRSFMNYERAGIAASLGAGGLGSSKLGGDRYEFAVEADDGDLEDFIPSSLSDLLTPEERSRRMSRSNSGQGKTEQLGVPGTATPGASSGGHRYSRSVPAPSLLGDISAIWSDNPPPNVNQGGIAASPSPSSRLGNGTPSSFTNSHNFGGRSFGDELSSSVGAGSPGMLLPSNASAAFLHHGNLHSHFAKRTTPSGPGNGMRNTSNPLVPTTSVTPSQSQQGNGPGSFNPMKMSNDPTGDYLRSVHRPIPQQHVKAEDPHMLSPGALALQAHAPGQSLPQGLAAGYSRIHALPPPLPMASPGSIERGAFSGSSPGSAGLFTPGPYGAADWSTSPAANAAAPTPPSKLSYSAAAAKGTAPPGVHRNVSGGTGRLSNTPLSPLSRPVVTGDDDDLFAMDSMER